jgi:hypothetical protein
MQDDFFGSKMGGEVEVDEIFIGGKVVEVSPSLRGGSGSGGNDK